MPINDRRSNRLSRKATAPKLPAAVKTVNDLLARDDVNGILQKLDKVKPDIKDMVIIYTDRQNNNHWIITGDTMASQANWLLDAVKMDLLTPDDEG